MLSSIKGKVVVVTGANRGIGHGIAQVFASCGAHVAVVARRPDAAAACAAELRETGGEAASFVADVCDIDAMRDMAGRVAAHYGGIDIVCANAGIYPEALIEKMSPTDWDTTMNTNARGAMFTLQACLPWLKQAEFGRVVLISSISGPITGYPGWSHYAASKAAQLGFMRSAALELARHRITVNAVLPGNTLTDSLSQLGKEYIDATCASIPLQRLGSVEDIAWAVLFLASREAAFITGQTLVVDGGQTLPENINAVWN